jgi:hypothetical protein
MCSNSTIHFSLPETTVLCQGASRKAGIHCKIKKREFRLDISVSGAKKERRQR